MQKIYNKNIITLLSKYLVLFPFYSELNKSNSLNPRKRHTKEKKDCV